MLWLDIERYKWSSDKETNQKFIAAMVDAGVSLGIRTGIYSSHNSWEAIVGLPWSYPKDKGLPIWYAHYDGSASFSDFTPFGGWSSPSIKQYLGDKSSCGAAIDYNFAPSSERVINSPPPPPPLTYDFLVQDVCADNSGSGAAVHGDPYACPTGSKPRDLRLGEPLPYHKHDIIYPAGDIYQLSDSFPLRHSDGSVRVVHTLDFAHHGAGVKNISFVQFDPDYDGYNANQFATGFASIVGTADPSGGTQYFVAAAADGGGCTTLDAWGLWDTSLFARGNQNGSHLFQLNIMRDQPPAPGHCPPFYNDAFTTYHIEPAVRFASGKVMESIVQHHWAGTTIEKSSSGEREYFTRAYGLSRWEAWVVGGKPSAGTCGEERSEGEWVMVDCRDWTHISPDPDGGYVAARYPIAPFLIAGSNALDNGDFGRGLGDVGAWREGSNAWAVEAEPSGNVYLALACTDACSSMHQDVSFADRTWPKEDASLSFGVQAWTRGGPGNFTLSLLQLGSDGAIVKQQAVSGSAAADKQQFSGSAALAAGVSKLRLALEGLGGEGVHAYHFDNAWMAAA